MTAIWRAWWNGGGRDRKPTEILLRSKDIGFPTTGFTFLLSKVQVVWHLKEVRSGRKAEIRGQDGEFGRRQKPRGKRCSENWSLKNGVDLNSYSHPP